MGLRPITYSALVSQTFFFGADGCINAICKDIVFLQSFVHLAACFVAVICFSCAFRFISLFIVFVLYFSTALSLRAATSISLYLCNDNKDSLFYSILYCMPHVCHKLNKLV